MTATLFFEDLQLGQKFVSGTHELDEAQIVAFARQFDPQPFHIDPEAAKNSLFGGLIASGWHTAAITMKLLVGSGINITGGLIGAGGEANWPRPTRPGSILHVETEVVQLIPLNSRLDRGMAVIRSETRDQHGDVVQVLTAKLVVPRRPVS